MTFTFLKPVFALAIATACTWALAQAPAKIRLPQETARLKTSSLPGYQIAMQKCGICHSADYISQQPPAMTEAQWTAEVRKMEHAYAAPLSDADVNQIGAYLSVTYGGVKVAELAAPPAATPAAAVAATGGAVDVQALLASNACLGCHGLTQKIVGPAYHDVALKIQGRHPGAGEARSQHQGRRVG